MADLPLEKAQENVIRIQGHPYELPARLSEPIRPTEVSLLDLWRERAMKDATTALHLLRCLGPPAWSRLYGIGGDVDLDLWTVFCVQFVEAHFIIEPGTVLEAWVHRFKPGVDAVATAAGMRERFERRTMVKLLTGDELVEGM